LVKESEKRAFLRPLSVKVLYGVGPATAEALASANLRTVADLQDYPGDLRTVVGSWGAELKRFALGEDDRPLRLHRRSPGDGSPRWRPRTGFHPYCQRPSRSRWLPYARFRLS
jgi:nucleotidyltransferase/DNA polymerase involved in DNA repair